ncbi:hypothetical protein [Streptomyces sp. NPDC058308]|uniref:hypothetical protein n=1 Tax=Streptomyces sp. NPDC058308 TaxID=3346440 RepID=UPI0036ED5E39
MLVVALLLLPVMGLLLIGMDRVEDRLTGDPPRRGAHRRPHLRLVAGHGRARQREESAAEHHDEAEERRNEAEGRRDEAA